MDERVMRAITANGMVPSTMAGRIRCITASLNAPSSSLSRVSMSMKPVFGSMSYSRSMRPETGVQPRLTEKNMIRIRPHQKIGIE
ncbi:hypothetical protein D3C78_1579750 [compost metagenome]